MTCHDLVKKRTYKNTCHDYEFIYAINRTQYPADAQPA